MYMHINEGQAMEPEGLNRRLVPTSILQLIGKTPLLELGRIVPPNCARILIKVESTNPTGSMKDRMALAMIEAGECSGRLQPGGHVVEYTGGSTGVSLALICAARQYPLSIVTSDAFSSEKRNHMAALGAKITIVPSVGGGMDEQLTRRDRGIAHSYSEPAQSARSPSELKIVDGRKRLQERF
jgi:cysteine synthase A